ncbi:MAG: hypothetical protein V4501_05770 [Pseudomonadota bacterium]
MNKTRILSFEMSQKVNDAEIEQVSAGKVIEPKVENSLCHNNYCRDISIEF